MSFLLHDCSQATAGRRFTHQLVDLGEGRVLDVQPVGGDAIQSRVVQHHLTCKKKKKHTHTDGQRAVIGDIKRATKKPKEEEFPWSGTRRGKSINSPSVFGKSEEGIEVMTQSRNLWERHRAPLFGEKTRNIKDTLYGCNGAGGSRGRFY